MTLADLHAFNVAAAWHAMTPDQQACIGHAIIFMCLAEVVAEDDGPETTIEDQRQAERFADAMSIEMRRAIEAAIPTVKWWDETTNNDVGTVTILRFPPPKRDIVPPRAQSPPK